MNKSMVTKVATLFATLALASVCKADGFLCRSANGNLNVKVYDSVQNVYGTRSAAYMIISNPQLHSGVRTLAVFSSAQGTLRAYSHSGAYRTYRGKVDLRFNNVRKGQFVLSEPMAKLASVRLHIYFNYNRSQIANGGEVMGVVDLVERNGHHVYSETSCTRYLKTAAF